MNRDDDDGDFGRGLDLGPARHGRRIHANIQSRVRNSGVLEVTIQNQRRRPRIVAVFSFRYDAHLVPNLIENLRPTVDGWISWDDRKSSVAFTPDNVRRKALIQAAYDAGANWVLGIDPDERLEEAAAWKLRVLVGVPFVESWSFRLRELYATDAYRVDGIWGRKRQAR